MLPAVLGVLDRQGGPVQADGQGSAAGVLPAGQEAAEKAMEKGCEVYRLYSDNTSATPVTT